MSHLPTTALSAHVAPSRRMGGQEHVWKASVPEGYQHQPAENQAPYDLKASKPWVKNPELLGDLVPPSEREGVNSDGISRKLAWLARNGYTVHTYEEYLTMRTPAPQISRKERRRLCFERTKVIRENAKFVREEAKAKRSSRHQPPSGPAMTTTPKGAYSHQSSPAPERYPSEAPMMHYDTPIPVQQQQQLNPSSWMDSYFYQIDPAFSPEAALPYDPAALMAEVNELFTQEEQVAYGFVPQGYYQDQPEQHYQQQHGAYSKQGYPEYSGYTTHGGTSHGFRRY